MKLILKKMLGILVGCMPVLLAAQPVYQATFEHGAAGYFGDGRGNKVTAIGNLSYVLVGEYTDTVDFDPGAGADIRIPADQEDVYIQRYDLQGNVLWTRTFDGVGREASAGHEVASDGSIYLSGSFYGSVDFDPGAGSAVYSFTGLPPFQANGFGSSLYLLKLDSMGDLQWVHAFGDGASFGGLRAVDTDAQGNVYTTGSVHARNGGIPMFDMDPSTGTDWFSHQGISGIVQKFDAAGNYLWGKSIKGAPNGQLGSPNVKPDALCIDNSGNVITAGYFSGNIDFDPNAGNAMVSSRGEFDLYLHKMGSNGQLLWVKSFGINSPLLHGMNEVTVDAQDNIYVMGYTRDSLDLDPGVLAAYAIGDTAACAFLAKYDPSGNLIYLKTWKGNYGLSLNDICVTTAGETYLASVNAGTTDVDPGPGVLNLTALDFDVTLIHLDAIGNFDWAIQIGDSSYDFGTGITLVGNQDLIATGTFSKTVDFDPGTGIDPLSAPDHLHTFVTHYGLSPATGTTSPRVTTWQDMALFPNPATNSVQLTWQSGKPGKVEWYGQTGALVVPASTIAGDKAIFDVAGLPTGVYYVVVTRANTRMACKLAVLH